jgi:uncharacterized protein
MFDPASITGKFKQMGFGVESSLILVVLALFRGFIAKRLISFIGYEKGNVLQAALFGAIHTVLFAFITSDIVFLLIIFIVPSIGAYVSVYLNEKIANGSIVPGWISHGLANILAYGLVGFVL